MISSVYDLMNKNTAVCKSLNKLRKYEDEAFDTDKDQGCYNKFFMRIVLVATMDS